VLVEETREEEPPNIRALEEAKADHQAEIENIQAQMAGAQEQVQEIVGRNPPLVARKEEIAGLVQQRDMIRQQRQDVLEEAVADRVKTEHAINQYKGKVDKQKKKAEDAEGLATAHEERLKQAMNDAKLICPKDKADLSKGRSRAKLETMITSLEKALRERERQVGGSSEEIYGRMQAAKNAYDENKLLIDDLRRCVKVCHRRTLENRA
jgi:chromosome segregation ATPase